MSTTVGQPQTTAALEEMLRQRVCGVCVDRRDDGLCQASCILFEKLPQLAACIARVDSTRMEDYIMAIRDNICATCVEQVEGVCNRRDEVRCVVDRYLPIIVNVIEERKQSASPCGTLLEQSRK